MSILAEPEVNGFWALCSPGFFHTGTPHRGPVPKRRCQSSKWIGLFVGVPWQLAKEAQVDQDSIMSTPD